MLRRWSLKIAIGAIIGCLMVSAAGINPAGAMIFPDLLSLVRVDNKDAAQKSGSEGTASAAKETYVVKHGDTLWDLSRKYHVEWKTIAYANNLELNGIIHVGQLLSIPCEDILIHVVKRGESLWEIARKYEKDIDIIAAENNIGNPDCVRVGTRLVIPQGEDAAVAAYAYQDIPSRYEGYWGWPVKGIITSPYGPRGEEFHHGLDIAADTGDKIFAMRAGIVEFSGWLNNIYGRAVIIDHGSGIKTLYAHNSKNLVKEGDKVSASTAIARIGNTGRSTGPHLHLEVHVDGQTVNPQKFLTD